VELGGGGEGGSKSESGICAYNRTETTGEKSGVSSNIKKRLEAKKRKDCIMLSLKKARSIEEKNRRESTNECEKLSHWGEKEKKGRCRLARPNLNTSHKGTIV